ncbi:hypothetical protein B0A52_07855 [Exophiala mesophila]|uniref:Uncharacterized protein n=1 Tax=Exophiala mesophila TaxID=212818 RepID=A0A438MVE8_EXOME|nr:hypothetical protein B0A52_07855 [Exophiala mesophila]
MTTTFLNTGLPLWLFILLIVVGSGILVATGVVFWRCWLHRRRARRADWDGFTGPTRRMTVRRGRMVPTSQHLSLTGSMFGTKQFGLLADNESTMAGRRSPSEWWNSVVDRSQSRQEQMSQVDGASIFTTRPSSRATSVGTRRDFRSATPTRTPEKAKDALTRVTELNFPSSSPSPPSPSEMRPTINFSRSFVRIPSSPLAQRSQNVLSLIEETSPHQSMIVNPPRRTSTRSSHFAAIDPLDRTPLPGPVVDSRSGSKKSAVSPITPEFQNFSDRSPLQVHPPPTPDVPIPPLPALRYNRRSMSGLSSGLPETNKTSPSEPVRPKTADAAHTRSSHGPQKLSKRRSTSRHPSITVPKPIAYTSFQPSVVPSPSYRQPTNNHTEVTERRSLVDRRGSTQTIDSRTEKRKSTASIGPSGIVYESQIPDYWLSRANLHDPETPLTSRAQNQKNSFLDNLPHETPVVSSEERENAIGVLTVPGKHNSRVLRKKSLRKMEMVSSVN